MPKPLSDHDVLIMLVALPLFVAAARWCGDLAVRLRQPQVLGELLAGVVLGPSVLGLLSHPALHALQRGAQILEPFSWAGIILLLAVTGLESDFTTLRRELGAALFTTLGGVLVPFLGGFALGQIVPQQLVGSGASRLAFSLFLALAMSISAVTVIAKVLVDLGQMRRTAAKIILAGGVFDETLGWILLALISGLAGALGEHRGGHGTLVDVLTVVGKAAAFLAASALFGRRFVNAVMRFVRDRACIDVPSFTATIVLALGFAAVTEALGLHQILGAFVFGVIGSTVSRIDRETIGQLRVVTRGFLVPLFFLSAGLRVDLTQLGRRDVAIAAAAFFGIAITGKLIGCTVGGLLARMRWREALVIGIGMNVRGSMEIVVAVLGLNLGILSPTIFSVIVLLSVLTILLVPSALRFAFAATPPDAAERARIEREERDEHAYTPKVRRVLVPIFHDAASEVGAEAARALARSKAQADEPLEIVVLRHETTNGVAAVPRRHAEERLIRETKQVETKLPIEVEEQAAHERTPVDAVNDAVTRGYQLVIVGVPRPSRPSAMFGPAVNRIIRDAACDVLVVASALEFDVDAVQRIVVPFTGKAFARAAGDLALTLASGLGASVRAISILRDPEVHGTAEYERLERRRKATADAIEELGERAALLGVPFESAIRTAGNPGREVLRELDAAKADLCIIGASDESHRGAPFFGDVADLLLRRAPTPVGLLIVRDRAA